VPFPFEGTFQIDAAGAFWAQTLHGIPESKRLRV
jgi:hypothetical protein